MKRKLIGLLLGAAGLVYGLVTFALPLLADNKAQAAAKSPAGNDAGYRVGDRLQPASPKSNASTATQAAPAAYQEVEWFALIPKGWEPEKMFKNMGALTDADPRAMDALQKLRE